MKKIIFFLLLSLCIVTISSYAQNNKTDINIVGHIIDKTSGEHIPNINIIVKGTNIYTTSDGSGHYIIKNISLGEITLETSGMGYMPQQKNI